MRFWLPLILLIILVVAWPAYAVISTVYSYSQIPEPIKQCRDERGHKCKEQP